MKRKIALLISILILMSFLSGCTTSEVFVNNNEFYGCIQEPVFMDTEVQSEINNLYEGYISECRQECPNCNCEADAKLAVAYDLEDEWAPGTLGKEVTLPFSFAISRCLPTQKTRLNNADLGIDMKNCPELEVDGLNAFQSPFYSFILYLFEYFDISNQGNVPIGCNPTSFKDHYLPPNSQCQLKESYLTVVVSENNIPLSINGRQISSVYDEGHYFYLVLFISGWDIDLLEEKFGIPIFNEIPSTINISSNEEYEGSVEVFIYRECCWHCNPKPSLPATILYPKVDIESFTLNNGDAIIRDGKVISAFNIAPGVQKTLIGVENRGFFTQNNVYIKFVGLPDGIEVTSVPESQKIKAHNIRTYEATFTVGPNVPSGTYKVSMLVYSPNGILDTIIMDIVVP